MKKYKCLQCDKMILQSSLLCKRCANIGINNPFCNKEHTIKTKQILSKLKYKHGGNHKCISCKKLIAIRSTRCKHCSIIKQHKDRKFDKYYNFGTIKIKDGYRFIKINDKFWQAEHRYNVEKFINRRLKKKEMIHHIDGNRSNNKLNNLYLFINRGMHTYLESLIRNKIIDRFVIKSNLDQYRRR